MESFFTYIQKNSIFSVDNDDDSTDRLSRIYTTTMIIGAVLLISRAMWFGGDPIKCWLPDHLKAQTGYIETTCWISNTYWVPFDQDIPAYPALTVESEARRDLELTYYQWIPYFLLFMAACFYLPCFIWRGVNDKSGIHVREMMVGAVKAEISKTHDRAEVISQLARSIDLSMNQQVNQRGSFIRAFLNKYICCLCGGRRAGTYLFSWYMFSKILYLANAIGQIFVFNSFFLKTTTDEIYGFKVIQNLWNNGHHSWVSSGIFPRVTMCDFLIRVMGNLHRHTVQCVMSINMFIEKIYVFFWLWFMLLSVLLIISIIVWLMRMGTLSIRTEFIKRFLVTKNIYNPKTERKLLQTFVETYLRVDGVFTLRLIRQNVGDLVVCDLVADLWVRFRKRTRATQQLLNSPTFRTSMDSGLDAKKNLLSEGK